MPTDGQLIAGNVRGKLIEHKKHKTRNHYCKLSSRQLMVAAKKQKPETIVNERNSELFVRLLRTFPLSLRMVRVSNGKPIQYPGDDKYLALCLNNSLTLYVFVCFRACVHAAYSSTNHCCVYTICSKIN